MLCLVAAATVVVRAQGPDLPPGPMQQKARTACMECHDAGIIVQQRLNAATWAKEVDKMRRWGALVDDKDRDALVEYLSSNFGADKPPLIHSPYQNTSSVQKPAGKEAR
jgi:hypothetical protein